MIPSDLDCCVEISVQRGQGYRFEKHAFIFFQFLFMFEYRFANFFDILEGFSVKGFRNEGKISAFRVFVFLFAETIGLEYFDALIICSFFVGI